MAWSRQRKVLAMLGGCVLLLLVLSRAGVRHLFVSAPGLTTETAATVLDSLLTNIYQAFLANDEAAIYDRLAQSVTGEQLTVMYLQTRRALQVEEAEGATLQIDTVKVRQVTSVKPTADGGVAVHAQWHVAGSVRHWGHTHVRRNLYEAVLTIVLVGSRWKLRDIAVLDEERLI